MKPSARLAWLAPVGALLLLALACNLPLNDGGADEQTAPDGEESSALRCELEGYPCSLAEADPAAVAHGAELLDEAERVFLDSGSMVAAAEQLRADPQVIAVAFDETGLWFRVQGAPPMWLWDFDVPQAPAAETSRSPAAGGAPLLAPAPQADGPIGPQPPGEEPQKQVLMLLPWAWQFGDESGAVEAELRRHRNYQCADCLTRRAHHQAPPDDPDDDTVHGPGLSSWFQDWDEYDLVYVLSHGTQWCGQLDDPTSGYFIENEARPPDDCAGFLTTGHMRASILDDIGNMNTRGIAWGKKPGKPWWYQAATPDYFRHNYDGGLDDALLFFNSCKLLANDSFSSALIGQNTAVLGWNQSVSAPRARAAANGFFERLIESGSRVEPVFDDLLGSQDYAPHPRDPYGSAQLQLHGEHDVRGRETISMLHPVYREGLEAIGHTMVHGIAGDGEPDELGLLLQFDGLDESEDPQAFEAHVAIDGTELEGTFTPERAIDEDSYWTTVSVPLAVDASELELVDLEAWIELPEGGETRHVLEQVELAACGWNGRAAGAVSGPLKGNDAIYVQNLNELDPADVESILQAQAGGQPAPIAANLEQAGELPLTITLGAQGGVPAVQAMADGKGLAIFGPTESFVTETGMTLNITRETDTRLEGTISGSLVNPLQAANLDFEADFTWHVGSRCSFQMRLQSIENAQADGEALPAD